MKINEIKQIEGLTVLLGGRIISQDAQGPRSILTTKEERRCAEHIVMAGVASCTNLGYIYLYLSICLSAHQSLVPQYTILSSGPQPS